MAPEKGTHTHTFSTQTHTLSRIAPSRGGIGKAAHDSRGGCNFPPSPTTMERGAKWRVGDNYHRSDNTVPQNGVPVRRCVPVSSNRQTKWRSSPCFRARNYESTQATTPCRLFPGQRNGRCVIISFFPYFLWLKLKPCLARRESKLVMKCCGGRPRTHGIVSSTPRFSGGPFSLYSSRGIDFVKLEHDRLRA